MFVVSLCKKLIFNVGYRQFSQKVIKEAIGQSKVKEDVVNPLTDLFGRHHTYLRISLTERCNLRCQYCMPAAGVKLTEKSKLLTTEEIIYLSKLFVNEGVTKIRLTGGEPTIRNDLPYIIENLKKIPGLETVAITTNGLVLTRKLVELQRAGLDQLNISLDTLKPERYEQISRRKGWDKVMMGIDLALQLGYSPVKINCVMMKGFNDDEIIDFVHFTKDRNVDVRFIEYMPFTGNKWEHDKLIPYNEIIKTIKKIWPDFLQMKNSPNDTSKAWKVPYYSGQVGFITSMSEHFCGTCNRLRITADGNLKVCLFGNREISLKDAIRSGCKEDDLVALINSAVKRKKKQHADFCSINSKNFNESQLFSHLFSRPIHPQTISLRNYSSNSNELSHVDNEGKASMVDVTTKNNTARLARAQATVQLDPNLIKLIKENSIKKGDVLTVSQIAGILGAKKTSEIIPLCHNIPLTNIKVVAEINGEFNQIIIEAKVQCKGKTGVEMEALSAVTVAALTIYDMCKALSREIIITNIHLLEKSGGRTDYRKATNVANVREYDTEPIEKGQTVFVGSV